MNPTPTCSKLSIETSETGVKYVQIQQYRRQNDVNNVVVCLVLTWNIFHTFF